MKTRNAMLTAVIMLILSTSLFVFANGRCDGEGVEIAVSPQMLLLGMDQSEDVVVHTNIPYGSVNTGTLTLNGIPVKWTKQDTRGDLVAYFDETAVKYVVKEGIEEAHSFTLTLTGLYKTGGDFSGSFTVMVREIE